MEFTEQELEDYLMEYSSVVIGKQEIYIIDRQVNLSNYKVDLVGKDFDGNIYLFELKKGNIDGNALSQLLNYIDYAQTFNKYKTKKIFGILVGSGITEYMKSALKTLPNIFYLKATPIFSIDEQTYSFTEEYLNGKEFKKNVLAFNKLFKGSEREDVEKFERSKMDQDNN
jgi:hypothetical protein